MFCLFCKWLFLVELVVAFGWNVSRLPHLIADDLAGCCMLLWTRVLRVIEVHQDQTWQVTLQMNANHHPGRMCLKELLVVSSDFFRLAFYDWQLHCCCIYKQRKQQDVDVQESWTGCWCCHVCLEHMDWFFFNQESFATWRMCINEVVLFFIMHLHPTSSDKGIEVCVDL